MGLEIAAVDEVVSHKWQRDDTASESSKSEKRYEVKTVRELSRRQDCHCARSIGQYR
jgi:hypothetical protein